MLLNDRCRYFEKNGNSFILIVFFHKILLFNFMIQQTCDLFRIWQMKSCHQ